MEIILDITCLGDNGKNVKIPVFNFENTKDFVIHKLKNEKYKDKHAYKIDGTMKLFRYIITRGKKGNIARSRMRIC
jgi:hypothetical protein